jgi:predicted phosphodiesterase
MLRLGVLTDIHWCPDPDKIDHWHNRFDFDAVPGRVHRALEWFREQRVDAVVVLGDLSHDGDRLSLEAVLDQCGRSSDGPLFVVPGNHDGPHCVELIAEPVPHLGADRRWDVSVQAVPVEFVAATESLRARDVVELASPGALILLTHYPLLSQAELFSAHNFKYAGSLEGAERLVPQLVARPQPTIVLCGHVHARESRAHRGVLQLTFGALVEPPHECATIELEHQPDKGLVVRRLSHRLAEEGSAREPVFAPDEETFAHVEGCWHECRAPLLAAGPTR